MKDFIYNARKNYLNIGDHFFSPIIEASAQISLSYRNLHSIHKFKYPFVFSFPEKNTASIWLSISLLTNLFFEDYINQLDNTGIFPFKVNDKVEIFGVVAIIEAITNEKIILRFSDQGGIPINKKLRLQISKTNKNHINKKSLFVKKYKEAKVCRNPISKILEPNDSSVLINEDNLLSKILLITGRGKINEFRSLMRETKIFDEPLNKVFIENKNLIIKKDLESFKNCFGTSISDKEINFKTILLKILNQYNNFDYECIDDLKQYLETDNFLTLDFKEKLADLVENFEEDIPGLKNIMKLFPGIKETLPSNIKAVIINEIEQIDLYDSTIKGFLHSGIPVIIVADRFVQQKEDINYFTNLFNKNPDILRINWNRDKIKSLKIINDENANRDYLDKNLWLKCERYLNQHIELKIFQTTLLDDLLPKTNKIVIGLDEFELLKRAYYNFLLPAAYLYKNSYSNFSVVKKLVSLFSEEYSKVQEYLTHQDKLLIGKVLEFLNTTETNTKQISDSVFIFSNLLPVNLDKKIFIPTNSCKINIPDNTTDSIIFSGFPYNEYSGRYLLNAICTDFVPQTQILCWPQEAELTYNYLKSRIMAGYFTDNLHKDWAISKALVLNNINQFVEEVKSFLTINNENGYKKSEEIDQENDLAEITYLKYAGFGVSVDGNISACVKCNILDFDDGSFMFLPKNSKVLAQIETDDGVLKFRNVSFSDLEIGFKVFRFKKDRKAFRELTKNNLMIKKAFQELELWRTLLINLYSENNMEIQKVEDLLLMTKEQNDLVDGNPLKHNIQRWIFDEELIAPEIENIRIILFAADQKDIDKTLEMLNLARKTVNGYTLSYSAKIKKNISKKIEKQSSGFEKEFKLIIDNVEIDVESRIITGLGNKVIEKEYSLTRKIINQHAYPR